jgi:hypothetical protein
MPYVGAERDPAWPIRYGRYGRARARRARNPGKARERCPVGASLRETGGTHLYGRNLISFKGDPHHLALH